MVVQCILFENCIINNAHKLLAIIATWSWKDQLQSIIGSLILIWKFKEMVLIYTIIMEVTGLPLIAMLIGYYIDHQDNNYRFKSMHIVAHK